MIATVIMFVLALIWLFPVLWAVINSFREYSYTQTHGYLSFGGWRSTTTSRPGSRANSGCT